MAMNVVEKIELRHTEHPPRLVRVLNLFLKQISEKPVFGPHCISVEAQTGLANSSYHILRTFCELIFITLLLKALPDII